MTNNLLQVYEEQLVVELEELLSNQPTTHQVEELLGKYGYYKEPVRVLLEQKDKIYEV
jgi:hypothetical protein